MAIAEKESGFDPNAKNPRTSASGVFQYIGFTWDETGKRGYRSNPKASPFDPEANIETMINQYIREIKPQIIKKLKEGVRMKGVKWLKAILIIFLALFISGSVWAEKRENIIK